MRWPFTFALINFENITSGVHSSATFSLFMIHVLRTYGYMADYNNEEIGRDIGDYFSLVLLLMKIEVIFSNKFIKQIYFLSK